MPKRTTSYAATMGQKREMTAFGDTLRKRIDAGHAVYVLNELIRGEREDITRTRFDAIKVALNKCLPDLQAVQLDVTDSRPATKADIDAMLLNAGIDPQQAYALT